ncbi:MAG: glycosyltransferase family 2 protein, partial [Clostridium sp.]|nr:glycosyltransferase family 2 protein [Clostridium sp.]
DDCWAPEKLPLQLNFAHHTQASFTFTGSAFMDEYGNRLSHELAVPEQVTYHQLLKQNIISCSSVMIQKDLLLQYPMGSDQMHEDFAVWLQILRDNHLTAHGLNLPLLIYRLSASSKSGNKLKAAQMTFRVYRHVGLSFPGAVYYWCWYTVRSLQKYRRIRCCRVSR